MAIMEISFVPIGTPTTSLSEYLVKAIKIAEEQGFKYHIGPMGTAIEGDVDDLFELARAMHHSIFNPQVFRVMTTIKIDDRRDAHDHGIDKKMKSLASKVRYKK